MSGDEADEKSKDPLTTRLSALGALVIAVGGIITTFVKPQDHSVTKAAYAETTKAIDQCNENQKADHDDIVALRAYVALKEGQPLFAVPVTIDAGVGGGHARSPHAAAAKPAAISFLTVAPPASAAPAAEPPVLHPEPEPVRPAAFDSVVKSVSK